MTVAPLPAGLGDVVAAFAVWASDRDTDASRAFMSALRLRPERWTWVDRPEKAGWWVVDGTIARDRGSLIDLHARCDQPRVAFLAQNLVDLPHPGWTYFRTPLRVPVLFKWLDSQLARRRHFDGAVEAPGLAASAPDAPWRRHRFRLRQWPNVSRYGDTLEIATTCAQLLRQPHDVAAALAHGIAHDVLERLLADAHAAGNLILDAETLPQAPLPAVVVEASDAGGAHRWGLITRVLRRFSSR